MAILLPLPVLPITKMTSLLFASWVALSASVTNFLILIYLCPEAYSFQNDLLIFRLRMYLKRLIVEAVPQIRQTYSLTQNFILRESLIWRAL